MNIAVCVKQVPDSWGEKAMDPESLRLDRSTLDAVLNENDEFAIEEALRLAESTGGSVTVISMGPAEAVDTVRKGLSMGADQGLLVTDPALQGADALATSRVLALAIQRSEADIAFFGSETTDARMGVVPAMAAEWLGWPHLTHSAEVAVAGGTVETRRVMASGFQRLRAPLPAVVSVIEKINEPRYPSFKGIMAAKKKPIDTVTLADLGAPADELQPLTVVEGFTPRPPKAKGQVFTDEGDGGRRIADFLKAQQLV